MIALLVRWFAPRIGEKYARFAAWAVVIVAAILFLWGAKALYDHTIISNHDAKQEASTAKADRAADQKASVQKEQDLSRQQYEDQQLTEAVNHAAKDPKIDDTTERRLAFHRCLGLQQRARANGLQPPRCV